jgi:peptide-N4-(N-acetyl-beta-glucosaminyl)asparagine amidase
LCYSDIKKQQQQQQQQHMSDSNINPLYITHRTHHVVLFINRVLSAHRTVSMFKDSTLQATALSLIPSDKLRHNAQLKFEKYQEENQGSSVNVHQLDHFIIKELLHWFKHEFFQWVNEPPCDHCKQQTTRLLGRAEPNVYERQGLASVVEVYQCNNCKQLTRFARYNHAGRLLETRKGRCGEWAQCFTILCIAMGYKARFVTDWTDHVWTEVFIEGRWQHADSCEETLDAPLMYESGWGKKLNLVIAAGFDELVDVTRRYTRQFYSEEFQNRRRQLGISEDFIVQSLLSMNTQLEIFMTVEQQQALRFMQEQEQEELRATQREASGIKKEELLARQSGSKEWIESRGEAGNAQSMKKSLCITPPSAVDLNLLNRANNQNNNLLLFPKKLRMVGCSSEIHENEMPGAIIRLTPNKASQAGALWFCEKQHVSKNSLFVSFSFRTVGSGADGLAFVMQNDRPDALGDNGCGIGYAGIKKSLAVEFDTFCTYDRCNDPDGNHVSVQTRYTEANSAHHDYSLKCAKNLEQDFGIKLNDGKIHKTKIVYNSATKTLHVSLDELWIIQDLHIDISKVFGGEDETCWIGFTASTGGLHEAHDILFFNFCQGQPTLNHEYITYVAGNIDGIYKKIVEFNATEQTKLIGSELNELKGLMNHLQKNIASNNFMWTQKEHNIVFKMILNWTITKQFPALDLLRICFVKYPDTMVKFYQVEGGKILWNSLMPDDKKQKVQPAANRMILYRLLSNLLASESARKNLLKGNAFETVFVNTVLQKSSTWTVQCNDKAPVREPFAVLLYNISLFLHENIAFDIESHLDAIIQLLSSINNYLKLELSQDKQEDKGISLILRAMLLQVELGERQQESDNIVKGLMLSMEMNNLLETCMSKTEYLSQQTRDIAKQLVEQII